MAKFANPVTTISVDATLQEPATSVSFEAADCNQSSNPLRSLIPIRVRNESNSAYALDRQRLAKVRPSLAGRAAACMPQPLSGRTACRAKPPLRPSVPLPVGEGSKPLSHRERGWGEGERARRPS
jgi:hypothetical protein